MNRYWTWESPNGNTKNQIDFILSSQRGIVKNCEVITSVDIASDHRMVRACIHISRKLARLKFIKSKQRKKVNLLKLRERKEDFQIQLKNRFLILEDENLSIDQRCSLITNITIEEAASVASPSKITKQKTKEDTEIDQLNSKRKQLREKDSKSTSEKVEYAELVKTTRKKRRQRNRKRKEKHILNILEMGKGPKEINKICQKKARIQKLSKKDGSKTSNREEILKICSDFYQELYNSQTGTHSQEAKIISTQNTEIPDITSREVEVAIKEMKKNKATGLDEITKDILEEGGNAIITQLVRLFNQIIIKKYIPKSWKEAKIILLHKKGDKSDIKNYRPISLLSHLYKLFTKIVQNRLKKELDAQQPREQAGFREGFSTTDHLHAINQLIEKSNEYQLDLCIGFIDYEKAFDSIEHLNLFQALREIGINEGYVCILEDIYTDATSRIHLDSDVSEIVKISRGVRQGDTLSPKVFTAAMEAIFKKLPLDERGINVDGEMLTDLRFADDVALTTSTVKDMETQLNDLNKESKKVGLKMHKGKTKYMTNVATDEKIFIEDQEIERVEEYKYLGQTLKLKDCSKEEVLKRIKAGWSCFGRHKEILCNKDIPMSLRRKVYNQCVLPTMTYGSETWSLTKYLETKLQTAQRAMERQMLHISLRDKVKCTTIRQLTGVADILITIKQSKWRWAGHVARRNDNRWTKRMLEWQPRMGKRRRGRQKRRWRDDITSYIGMTWARVAEDRKVWSEHEEGYIQQWIDIA